MSRTTFSHPKYSEMITSAITTLKERNGSSRQAICKYVKTNYPLGEQADLYIKTSLRKMVANCDLIQTKGTGASGSFKLNKAKLQAEKKAAKQRRVEKAPKKSADLKENEKPVTKVTKQTDKKPAAKKPAATKDKADTKKPAAKKPATKKKSAAKKANPQNPSKTESSCSDHESSED